VVSPTETICESTISQVITSDHPFWQARLNRLSPVLYQDFILGLKEKELIFLGTFSPIDTTVLSVLMAGHLEIFLKISLRFNKMFHYMEPNKKSAPHL
jgi:hypothetical protein